MALKLHRWIVDEKGYEWNEKDKWMKVEGIKQWEETETSQKDVAGSADKARREC